MSKPGELSEEERAELVAYLDGESSGEARRAIEAKLNLDAIWRAEAESLKRAWDLLDFLPRPEPSPNFTQRTLLKLEPIRKAASLKPVVLTRQPFWLAAAGVWAAAVLLAFVGSYAGYRALGKSGPGETELTRDLRIIENRRFYDLVDDLEFLNDLDDPELFGEEGVGG